MNSDKAGSIIVGSMGTAVVLATIHDLTTKNSGRMPAMKVPVGGFVATVMLLGLASPAPDLAAMLAVLVMLGVLFGPQGEQVFKVINQVVGAPTQGLKVPLNTQNLDTPQPITKMGRAN